MISLLQEPLADPTQTATMLNAAMEQFPALTLMVITIGWLTRTYLRHTREIMDDHSRVMDDLIARNTRAIEQNTQVIGSALEALRKTA